MMCTGLQSLISLKYQEVWTTGCMTPVDRDVRHIGTFGTSMPLDEIARLERVEALLPESALPGLDAELRSLSQGLAGFTAEFDHLAELGGKYADDVIKARAAAARWPPPDSGR